MPVLHAPSLLHAPVLLLFACFSLLAQPTAQAQVDAQAEKVIKRAQRAVKKTDDLQAEFKYFLLDRAEKAIVQQFTGLFKMQDDSYYLNMADQEIFCNGATVWDYRPEFQEVNVTRYDPQASFGLQQVFDILEEDMKMKYEGQQSVGKVECYKVNLFPSSKGRDFFKAEIWISTGDDLPRKLAVWNNIGTVATYEITSMRTKVGFPESTFTFDQSKHPQVEVVDLR